MKKLFSKILLLRLEEAIAIVFFLPMVYFTTKAYTFFLVQGKVPRRIEGDMQRIWVTLGVLILFLLIIKYKPNWKILIPGSPSLVITAVTSLVIVPRSSAIIASCGKRW